MGKSSLRSWRQLALEQLDEQDGDAEQSNGKMNGSTLNKGNNLNLYVKLYYENISGLGTVAQSCSPSYLGGSDGQIT